MSCPSSSPCPARRQAHQSCGSSLKDRMTDDRARGCLQSSFPARSRSVPSLAARPMSMARSPVCLLACCLTARLPTERTAPRADSTPSLHSSYPPHRAWNRTRRHTCELFSSEKGCGPLVLGHWVDSNEKGWSGPPWGGQWKLGKCKIKILPSKTSGLVLQLGDKGSQTTRPTAQFKSWLQRLERHAGYTSPSGMERQRGDCM